MLIRKRSLILIDVFYFIPKSLILQEFAWETEDVIPDMPRAHKFLNYWHDHIDATISEVIIMERNRGQTIFRGSIHDLV